jgi:hypothetical protein
MKELTFEYIKSQFENKCFFYRSEFIKGYHFKDTYFEYYKNFILNYTIRTRDDLYLSNLIDLATDLSIYDTVLIDRYISMLLCPNSILVKLSCVNYLLEGYYLGKVANLEEILRLSLKATKSEILKSEILVYIFGLFSCQDDFLNLTLLLSRANNHHTATRMLNTLGSDDIYIANINIEKKRHLINILLNANTQKNYGSGFREAFNELPLSLRISVNEN